MTVQWLGLSEKLGNVSSLHSAVSRTGNSIQWQTSLGELKERLDSSGSAVVFLFEGATYDIYEVCLEFSLRYPLASFVVVVNQEALDLRRAMRAGAVDAIAIPVLDADAIVAAREAEQSALIKASRNAAIREDNKQKDARVITVCGTKGGVGKTTLSVNLAVAFAKMGLKVVLLDLDLQFGDAAILLDIQPKKTIYEWVKEEYENSAGNLDRYLQHHSSGVALLPAPLRPEFAEVVAGEHVGIAIGELRRQFDLVLVDTPPALLETGLVALDNSSDILLVTASDLPTLKNSKLCIETLESLGLQERLKLVLNRDTKNEGIAYTSIQTVLDAPIFSRVPSEGKTVMPSVNKGNPFVLSAPRAAVSKSVFELAAKLISEQQVNVSRSRKSILQKVFS